MVSRGCRAVAAPAGEGTVRITFGFFVGVALSMLLLWGIQTALPIRAQTDNISLTSDNFSLVHLLPDIEKIYQEALISPLKQAEAKIYDEDIAEFYHRLLERTILGEQGDGAD